jgi:exosortase A-associated hydrolase 1
VLTEQAFVFDCRGDALVGILHAPETPADVGVVIVVGGPQYRVGSHRQFVQLARALCRSGYAVLRFDARGMGDSQGDPRTFDRLDDDIGAAIDALLVRARGVSRVVLWGLCDGASAAWLYLQATSDRRVCGVCAVNPWVRSPESLARTQVKHYYAQRMLDRAFWSKLFRGGVGWQALRGLAGALRVATTPTSAPASAHSQGSDFRVRMAQGCARCGPGGVLLVLSSDDYTAKEFVEHAAHAPHWQDAWRACAVRRCDIAGADHTLSQEAARVEVEAATLRWLDDLGGRRPDRVRPEAVDTGRAA